jgi:hypothetical protein
VISLPAAAVNAPGTVPVIAIVARRHCGGPGVASQPGPPRWGSQSSLTRSRARSSGPDSAALSTTNPRRA